MKSAADILIEAIATEKPVTEKITMREGEGDVTREYRITPHDARNALRDEFPISAGVLLYNYAEKGDKIDG